MKSLVFHLVGLSTTLVCAVWVLFMFVGIALEGKVIISEPNFVILGVELFLFGFAMIYAGFNLKNSYLGLIKKLVSEKQKKEFYK